MTLELSRLKSNYFDPIRKKNLVLLPEEIIRQKLIFSMVNKLGFPKGLISIEKELSSITYLKDKKLPLRRVDIMVFARDVHPQYELYPLLIIECKRDRINKSAKEQLLGYNLYIKAYYAALAGKDEFQLFYHGKDQKEQSLNFLPRYEKLKSAVKAI